MGKTKSRIAILVAVIIFAVVAFLIIVWRGAGLSPLNYKHVSRIGKGEYVETRHCPLITVHGGCGPVKGEFSVSGKTWKNVLNVVPNEDDSMAVVYIHTPPEGIFVRQSDGKEMGRFKQSLADEWFGEGVALWCGSKDSVFVETYTGKSQLDPFFPSAGASVYRFTLKGDVFSGEPLIDFGTEKKSWRRIDWLACAPKGQLAAILVGLPEKWVKGSKDPEESHTDAFRASPGPAELVSWSPAKGLYIVDRWDWKRNKPDPVWFNFDLEFTNEGDPKWCLGRESTRACRTGHFLESEINLDTYEVIPGKSLGDVKLGESFDDVMAKGFAKSNNGSPGEFLRRGPLFVRFSKGKVAEISIDGDKIARATLRGKPLPANGDPATMRKFLTACEPDVTGSGGILIDCENRGVELVYSRDPSLPGLAFLSVK
jgi:hypothetical protein